jgi:hypothetical protein
VILSGARWPPEWRVGLVDDTSYPLGHLATPNAASCLSKMGGSGTGHHCPSRFLGCVVHQAYAGGVVVMSVEGSDLSRA